MYKKRSSSRSSYIFTIIAWIIIFSSVIVFFGQLDSMESWGPIGRRRIDVIHTILAYISIWSLLASIISWIIHEIRHSSAINNIVIRRFLPLIRFTITAGCWIIILLQMLEELDIDTRSILTGAWIWWAILALAAKDVMTNFLGSLSLLLGRVFDIWEVIRIRTSKSIYEWIVEEITLNYTKITNQTGELVYIPNRIIYSETVENISRERFETYEYIIPFPKASPSADIQERVRLIEWKISEYNPLKTEWKMENPNAWDFVYRVIVKLPEESELIDREIRLYLMEHIFRG